MNINFETKNKPVLPTRFVVEQKTVQFFTSIWMTMGIGNV